MAPIRGTSQVADFHSTDHHERLAVLLAVVFLGIVVVGLLVNLLSLGDCFGHACNMWNDGIYR